MRHDPTISIYHTILLISGVLILTMASNATADDVPDTRGKEFVLVAPIVHQHGVVVVDVIPQVRVTTNVNFSLPSTSPPVTLTFTIEPSASQKISLPLEFLLQGTEVTNKGILVRSSSDVSIVLRYTNHSDGCLVLPKDVLGAKYVVLLDPSDSNLTTMLSLVAGSSGVTIVNITGIRDKIATMPSGGTWMDGRNTLQLTLNAYQAVQFISAVDISGALLTATNPVGVFCGRTSTGSDVGTFVWEMLPPVNTWGKKFVLVSPGNLVSMTARIIVKSNSSVRVYTHGVLKTYEVVELDALTLTFPQESFVHIQTNVAALVLQTIATLSNGGLVHKQMFYVPPVEQYLTHYAFSVNNNCSTVCLRSINPFVDVDGFLLDGEKVAAFTNELSFYVEEINFTVVSKDAISNGFHHLKHMVPTHSFCAYASDETLDFFQPLGMRMANLYDACSAETVEFGGLGDGKDNDCDGLVDEELLNNIDDDKDGRVDEDTVGVTSVNSQEISVVKTDDLSMATGDSSDESTIDNNIIAVIVSLTVAILAILLLIGICLLHDFLQRRQGIRRTRISPFVS